MNRRKALRNIAFIGTATLAVSGSGSAIWYRFYHRPDIGKIDHYRELLDEMAEIIIPETDTPGAKSAGVGSYIITMLKDCTPRNAQNRFLNGLAAVESYAASTYGRSFVQCSANEKKTITAHFEKRDRPFAGIKGKIMHRLIGPSFFTTLKKYTVTGYCTSMKGATMGMAYDYIPGRFTGCIPMTAGQKCWAT